MSEEINENQFITLDFLKSFLKITDSQDDDTLLEIVKSSNNELKKQLKTVVDDITAIEGTKFFDRAQDTALTFALSKVRRNINQMYDEADKLKANYTSEIETLLGDVRAIAPVRTSRQVVSKEVDFEDEFFENRRFV